MRFVAAITAFFLVTTLHVTEIFGMDAKERKKIEDYLTSISNAIIKIKKDVQRLTCSEGNELKINHKASSEFHSCKEILESQRNNTASGVHEISVDSNKVESVYC
ncbi:uncharacterized protein LOC114540398 isoform X2 [Dendronephthya gigantea]|uniref:uncharacterized protein LOC114540398 isoform X2 n=1 Tax=Dendronephthya gigantea TaxID=151771 RepID=UPI00106A38E2|nr:uncharacterized protein LOC114540398 isoform X2 [Dendronephthya gigantea]